MKISSLNRKITIQQAFVEKNKLNGSEQKVWRDYLTNIWAGHHTEVGTEKVDGAILNNTTTINFILRYRSDIHTQMRIIDQDRIYNIKSLSEVDNQDSLLIEGESRGVYYLLDEEKSIEFALSTRRLKSDFSGDVVNLAVGNATYDFRLFGDLLDKESVESLKEEFNQDKVYITRWYSQDNANKNLVPAFENQTPVFLINSDSFTYPSIQFTGITEVLTTTETIEGSTFTLYLLLKQNSWKENEVVFSTKIGELDVVFTQKGGYPNLQLKVENEDAEYMNTISFYPGNFGLIAVSFNGISLSTSLKAQNQNTEVISQENLNVQSQVEISELIISNKFIATDRNDHINNNIINHYKLAS